MKAFKFEGVAAALLVATLSAGGISTASAAAGGDFGVGNGGDGLDILVSPPSLAREGTYAAPVPFPSKKGSRVSYSGLREMWVTGTKATPEVLTGTWKNVAFGATPACAIYGKDSYEPSGIVWNSDVILKLKFGQVTVAADPFAGTKEQSGFAVEILSEFQSRSGTQKNGPYRVDSAEPQFSAWPAGDEDGGGYFETVCRILPENQKYMICAESLVIQDKADSYWDPVRPCGRASQGMMYGYIKE